MSKRKYSQRESGLYVPGGDSIELPKPEQPNPWYAGMLSPWRGMGRRRCCCEELAVCSACSGSGDNAPAEWQVVISGVSDVGSPCDCTQLNDTFALAYTSDCIYQYSFGTCLTCDSKEFDSLILTLLEIAGTYYLRVSTQTTVGICGAGTLLVVNFELTSGSAFDCLTMSNQNVPLQTNNCGGTPTCVVTAL